MSGFIDVFVTEVARLAESGNVIRRLAVGRSRELTVELVIDALILPNIEDFEFVVGRKFEISTDTIRSIRQRVEEGKYRLRVEDARELAIALFEVIGRHRTEASVALGGYLDGGLWGVLEAHSRILRDILRSSCADSVFGWTKPRDWPFLTLCGEQLAAMRKELESLGAVPSLSRLEPLEIDDEELARRTLERILALAREVDHDHSKGLTFWYVE